MTERGYYLRVMGGECVEVKGTPVKVEGGFDVFVHRLGAGWSATEGRTGCFIGNGGRTKQAAMQEARDEVARQGVVATRNAIRMIIEQYGLSPRYRDKEENCENSMGLPDTDPASTTDSLSA